MGGYLAFLHDISCIKAKFIGPPTLPPEPQSPRLALFKLLPL